MKTILDLLLIGIILICGWTGYKKGIIMGLGGIVVIVVAVFGANLVSNTFSYEVIPAMRPFASGYMEKQIRYSVFETLDIEIPSEEEEEEETSVAGTIYSTDDLLADNPEIVHDACVISFKKLGIYDDVAQVMADEAIAYAGQHAASIPTAIVEVICEDFSYVLGFIISFLIILIGLTVLGNILNLSFRFPGFELVDGILGAVLGIITGFMFCAVVVWVLRFAGLVVSEEEIEDARIVVWFLDKAYLTGIIGL